MPHAHNPDYRSVLRKNELKMSINMIMRLIIYHVMILL